MRTVLLAGIALLTPGLAFADQSVAGQWKAELGSNVAIVMNVTADGKWESETSQNGSVVAKMTGTYRQTKRSQTSGNLVFTPTQEQTGQQHGAPTVEYDAYQLAESGNVLRLTSSGDTMVFHKQ
jgi:hypothetical protein